MSHPAWVCGLKRGGCRHRSGGERVTPCVGVWIETSSAGITSTASSSHPAWVCGLKQETSNSLSREELSHPAWVCGLKQETGCRGYCLPEVTPCVGVWIETPGTSTCTCSYSSHPAWVCGLKPHRRVQRGDLRRSHPAWVCGLKRKTSRSPILLYGSHPAWVCGLKLKTYCTIFYYLSHTLRGCVD